ncbi:hypothetical protein [Acinetobacter nosocomialis]|uniref:hypothetical protein n=1 Tax=Acinetobacter nosocomialis TaxID=106654 RepID=UPI0031F35EAB
MDKTLYDLQGANGPQWRQEEKTQPFLEGMSQNVMEKKKTSFTVMLRVTWQSLTVLLHVITI